MLAPLLNSNEVYPLSEVDENIKPYSIPKTRDFPPCSPSGTVPHYGQPQREAECFAVGDNIGARCREGGCLGGIPADGP